MPKVHFTRHLVNQLPIPSDCIATGNTLAEVVADLEKQFPGLAAYIVDERGAARKHVNFFVGDTLATDRAGLSDKVSEDQEIYVMQALSGG